MHQLKKISADAIPRAIQKAERYRLLNQSWATESICLDILEVDPTNQPVLVMLLLSLTDQFGPQPKELSRRAHGLIDRLTDPYQRSYYDGIIHERLAHAQLAQNAMHAEEMARDSLRVAMSAFEEAERQREPGNDNALLRWNTCARTLERMRTHDESEVKYEPHFGE
ncbi:MAG: hypothetical protein M3Z05_14930 [Gemmatimonadota bacterium]|nr:hypothetical protein [Gemmatimonadota bacterium]